LIIAPFKRKVLKITAYVLGSLLLLATAFHFWFINHAEGLIEDMVQSQSKGKLRLHVKKFRFDWFSYDMQLRNAVFYSTDTTEATTGYQFSVDRINIRIKEILPLVLEKKILIDSLRLINPNIQVTKLRASKDTSTGPEKSFSLPQEMGRVYNSIQDALAVLQVNRFQIDNGRFTLSNKIQTDELPVTITNIHFYLDNLQVDTTELTGTQKILFSDNVALQTHDQDIFFPDGRHRLSFSNFRINIAKKIVEFDSCTMAASKGDSARSSFKIFFDKLRLTNIDFDTLYQKEVIKADSVYCINPQFRLDIELAKKGAPKKSGPTLNELIQQLTGDLHLAFVVVENGSFDINTVREGDGRPSSFTSNHNNFEVQGLRVQKDAPRPLTVKSFAMAIRNYENFLRDSTSSMQFDSILFFNNNIYLSNFALKQKRGKKTTNSFDMPQFVLSGLSWDDLVFERRLTAEKASLYNPVIDYTPKSKGKNKQDIFESLEEIGNLIQLNQLDVSNGHINIHFRGGGRMQLQNASMSLLGKDLVEAKGTASIQQSVTSLRFKKGSYRAGNLVALMEDVDFTGKSGQLKAGKVTITDKRKNLSIDAKHVSFNKMTIDKRSYVTEIDGMQWQEADIDMKVIRGNKAAPGLVLKNIHGRNSKLNIVAGSSSIKAFFENLSADEFIPKKGSPKLTNLRTNGRDLSFAGNDRNLKIARFNFADDASSTMEGIRFSSHTIADSINAELPSLSFVPDLQSMLRGNIVADNVVLNRPKINLQRFPSTVGGATTDKSNSKTPVAIGRLRLIQPEIYFAQTGHNGVTTIEWRGKDQTDNSFDLVNFRIDPGSLISADQLSIALRDFSITTAGRSFDAGKGNINARINKFHMAANETGEWDWNGTLTNLKANDFKVDSVGKNAGTLELRTASINDLSVGTNNITSFRELVKDNKTFRINELSGHYEDAQKHFYWDNINYDKNSKTFSLDSFSYRPAIDKDTFLARQNSQVDYLTLQTGAVAVGPFDIESYLRDTVVNAGTAVIDRVFLTSYRDKRLPFTAGIIKPLPVALLKKIPVKISVDTIKLLNSNIEYSEVNAKNGKTGIVTINNLEGNIYPVKNYEFGETDSMMIAASGRLMDSVKIQLYVKESYTDSLYGFLMNANIGPADAKVLNEILIPLASAKLESGYVDTMSMRVVGREYLSLGDMKLFYHDLKIKLLNPKNQQKTSLVRGFASFLANTLIKNKNESRTGKVFFERDRSRSTLHYLVKITFSGVASSVGIRNNKKVLRKYKKQLRKRNLPPIDNDYYYR
jgi:hypothetical protein